jgi:hypothetical protein
MAVLVSVMKGAIGLKIILTTTASVVGATVRKIRYQKPSGAVGEWTAVQETGTSISFTTTVASDLDEAGDWNLQAYVENGWKLPGTQDVLHVDENIDIPVTP